MVLLDTPFDRAAPTERGVPWGACGQIAVPALATMVVGLMLAHRAESPLGHAVAGAAAHAAMLGLGWALLVEGRRGWQGPAARLGALVFAAALLSHSARWGACAYLAVPIALLWEARRRPELIAAGMRRPPALAAVVGILGGAFLGLHLLITASLTFGYAVRLGAPSEYLAAAAYDAGLSAVTAEWLFRGAIFSLAWRRAAFGVAAALSSGLAVGRYVIDPHLPGTVEVWLGAAFYMGLLSAGACALRAWSRSLVPGYLATVMFFLAYRTLGTSA